MSAPAVATPRFAGFRASVGVCGDLLRRSWALLIVAGLACGIVALSLFVHPRLLYVVGSSLLLAATPLVALRSQLLGSELYLPASARTRSLAVALAGTALSGGMYSGAAVILGVALPDGPVLDPTPVLACILGVGAASLLPEVLERVPPLVGWIAGLGALAAVIWGGASTSPTEGDLLRLVPLVTACGVLLVSRLPRPWLRHVAPALVSPGIRDSAFPAAPADPILAVRALLAAERGRSVAWRLVPAGLYVLLQTLVFPLESGDHPVWELFSSFGIPLFVLVPFILPVSAFGAQATPVVLTLPVAPLAVHHAVVREAAIRAGMVFGIFAAYEAVPFSIRTLTSAPVSGASHLAWVVLLGLYSWPVPAFAMSLGASAWVSYPSPLRVFLVKMGVIAGSVPVLLVLFGWLVLDRADHSWENMMGFLVQLQAFTTLLGLFALLLGELRARRAWRPYREAA